MNEHSLPDADFDRRLRADLESLVGEAGDPPPFPSSRSAPPRSPRLPVAVAAVAVLAVALGALIWSVQDREEPELRVSTDRREQTDRDDRPLVGTRWWLATVERGGKPVDLGGADAVGLHLITSPCESGDERRCDPEGPTMWASDACNGFSGTYELPEPGTLEVGAQVGPTTQMGCAGPLVEALRAAYSPGSVSYEIRADELVLSRDDVVLVYQASDGPFAPTEGTVVDEGQGSGESYRLVWEEGFLTLQTADTEQGIARGGTGLGEDPGRINPARSTVGGRPYLLAIIPDQSARVVYEPAGGTPQELDIRDVGSASSAVVGAFVDDAPDTWYLVAYDTDGLELHRYRWGE